MCAIGAYAKVNHSTTNTSTPANRARSAKAPRMRQHVIAAKVHWKATKSSSGITTPLEKVAAIAKVPALASTVPLRKRRSMPPKYALFSVKARL